MDLTLEKHTQKQYKEHILCLDIGGTTTQIGIIGLENKTPQLCYAGHLWSKDIKNFENLIKQILQYTEKNLQIKIEQIAIAAAGPNQQEKIKIIHLNKTIHKKPIERIQGIKKVILLNDFEALGYAINLYKEVKNETKNIAVIGPGTGLGKAILKHNGTYYEPIAGEGGHSEFPIRNEEELELKKYIKGKKQLQYEDLISGKGIEHIYEYTKLKNKNKETKYTKEIDKTKHKIFLISQYKEQDKTCKETYKIFTKLYARAVKNYALETLPLGGIYLAGGITTRNPEIIDKEFFKELENLETGQEILKGIPIHIMKQKETSLLGAAYALIQK
ncbi:glucokinase [Candidatus Woesearchaeota archaeon]|nr:glucokinase [Candidatus Woesearchaeota archaeon]